MVRERGISRERCSSGLQASVGLLRSLAVARFFLALLGFFCALGLGLGHVRLVLVHLIARRDRAVQRRAVLRVACVGVGQHVLEVGLLDRELHLRVAEIGGPEVAADPASADGLVPAGAAALAWRGLVFDGDLPAVAHVAELRLLIELAGRVDRRGRRGHHEPRSRVFGRRRGRGTRVGRLGAGLGARRRRRCRLGSQLVGQRRRANHARRRRTGPRRRGPGGGLAGAARERREGEGWEPVRCVGLGHGWRGPSGV